MSIETRKDEYSFMKRKAQNLTEKMPKVISLTYDLIPTNLQDFQNKLSQVRQSMKLIDSKDKDLSQHDQLILGKIEGQSAFSDFKKIIQSIVGEINQEKLKLYLKQKTQQRNYGISMKDKNCSIKQVKKLQYLNKYFDIQQINKKRKHNILYRSYIKNLQKFLELFSKTDQNNNQAIQNSWQQYHIFIKQQKKFQAHLKQIQTIPNVIEKQVIPEIVQSQSLLQQEAKQQQKIQQKNQQQQKNIQQKKQLQNKEKTQKKKSKTVKRNKKEEIEIPQINNQINQAVVVAENNLNQKINEQAPVPLVPSPVLIKKDDKQKSLFSFFQKKPQNPIKLSKPFTQSLPQANQIILENQQLDVNKEYTEINKKIPQCWLKIGSQFDQKPDINQLRSEFRSYKMQNQQATNESYFINMIITLSTIEYFDYLIKVDREVDFTAPFKKIKEILYFQDQSQQFDGQSASGNMQDQQQQEQALSQGNKTILDDDHLSNQQLSSCQSNQLNLKVQYGKGIKWTYSYKIINTQISLQMINQFQLICLQNEPLPLPLEQQQEKVQLTITNQIWRDIYKITHGYFGSKDLIIKQISTILPNVSKNWIDTMLKQRSQKVGNQRFIIKAFIQDLKQKITDIQQILQGIKSSRNDQLQRIKNQKNQQKDLKLQKDILQCIGSRYIINLMKQLKQKGYKQLRKKQLIDFINQRNGEQWEKIKKQMNTMSINPTQTTLLKSQQNNVNNEINCEQEVIVQDDEYKKLIQKEQPKQNSQASTKQKQILVHQELNNHNIDKKRRQKNNRPIQIQKTLQFPSIINKNGNNQKRQTKLKSFIKKNNQQIQKIKTNQQICNKQQQKMIEQKNQNQMISQIQQQIKQNIKIEIGIGIQQLENSFKKQIDSQHLNKTSEKFQDDL